MHGMFGVENGRARDNLENLRVDGRIMMKRIFRKWNGFIDWIYVAKYRDRNGVVVYMVMYIRLGTGTGLLCIW